MQRSVNWLTASFFVLFHLGTILTIFTTFSWGNLALALVNWWIMGSLGIGVGFHRLLTHRGFKTPKWFEYQLTIFGLLALQKGQIEWVAIHRDHHQFGDQPGLDPHTPRDGGWWAHIGWMIWQDPALKTPEFLKRYAKDLLADPIHAWLNRWFWLPIAVLGVALFFLGGLPLLLWGVCVPITFGWHFTWLVNSVTHMWGRRDFRTPDDSRNNWLVATVSFGEGWHNSHHAFPTSVRHGLKPHHYDLNWRQIKILEFLGLAWNLQLPTPKQLAEKTL